MRVIVLGGAGQLGTLVVGRLSAERKVKQVISLDRVAPMIRAAKLEHHDIEEKHFEGADAVVRVAPIDDPEFDFFDGADLARTLARAGVRAFVDCVRFDQPAVEVECRQVRLRIGTLVGRRMARRALSANQAPFSLVWDEDVADAVARAVAGEARGDFTLIADPPISLGDLAKHRAFKQLLLRRELPRLSRVRGSGPEIELSRARAREVLEWKPRCPNAFDVMRRAEEIVPRRPDPRVLLFFGLADALGKRQRPEDLPAEARRMTLTVNLDLTGPGGGDWVLQIREGRARMRRGVARPPDGTITLAANAFLGLLAGKDDLSRARMAGRVRLSGEPNVAYMFAGMIQGFRNAIEKPGMAAVAGKALERWFAYRDGGAR